MARCRPVVCFANCTLLEQLNVSFTASDASLPVLEESLRELQCLQASWASKLPCEGLFLPHADHEFSCPAVSSACALGARPTYEDAWGATLDGENKRILVLCDGHAGPAAARIVAGEIIRAAESGPLDERGIIGAEERLERELLSSERHCGTTVAVWREGGPTLNVGDSRILLSVSGSPSRLSRDHSPSDEEEVNILGGFYYSIFSLLFLFSGVGSTEPEDG